MSKLKDKVAVVTGASKGIGASIARQLAAEGAAVVVNYASSKEGADRVVAEAKKAFGKLDILVNNAGVYEFIPLEDVSEEHFHRLFNLNVLGLILSTQEAVKHFGPSGGSVVNISSIASTYAPPNGSVYSGTKAAVDAVNPGMIDTEGFHAAGFADSDFQKEIVALTPLGRIGNTDDVAPAVAFLASAEAAWITGETWVIAGGLH